MHSESKSLQLVGCRLPPAVPAPSAKPADGPPGAPSPPAKAAVPHPGQLTSSHLSGCFPPLRCWPGSRPVSFGACISESICSFPLDAVKAEVDAADRQAASGKAKGEPLGGRDGATAGATFTRDPEMLRPWQPGQKESGAAQEASLLLLWVDTRINTVNELFHPGWPTDPRTQRHTHKHIDHAYSRLADLPQKVAKKVKKRQCLTFWVTLLLLQPEEGRSALRSALQDPKRRQ